MSTFLSKESPSPEIFPEPSGTIILKLSVPCGKCKGIQILKNHS